MQELINFFNNPPDDEALLRFTSQYEAFSLALKYEALRLRSV